VNIIAKRLTMCLEACSQLRFNNVFIVIYLLLDCDKKKSEKILFYTLIFSGVQTTFYK
jgi:hypothetical protein